MNKEKLDALLASGVITQEEYDDLIQKYGLDDNGGADPDPQPEPDPKETEEQRIERLVKQQVDKITAKLGKDKADLQKKYNKLKEEKLTDEDRKNLELAEKENEIAERERALLEKENRLYAIKAIKAEGLDDGTDKALELVEFVLCDDTDEIDSRVKAFGALVKKFAKSETDKIFKENGRSPNTSRKTSTPNNPWMKETFNLTEQWRLEAENPELAASYKAAAGVK